jgi:hypothetical protein
MKTRLTLALALTAAAAAVHLTAQTPATSRTRAHVTTLASPKFEGRLAGSPGERLASEYIVTQLKRIGARPLPGRTGYRLPFEFTAGTKDGGSSMEVRSAAPQNVGSAFRRTYSSREEIQALSFSDNGDVTGPVVFAGYGIVVPESQSFGYDSYATLDVKDKVVLVLRYFPEDADAQTRGILARYADLRYKAMAARQRGARAVLVAAGPRSPNAGQTIPMTFDTALAGSGIVAASISGTVAGALFDAIGDKSKTLEAVQRSLDSGNPHVAGFDIPRAEVTIRTNVVRERRTGSNVAGYLPATASTSGVTKPWVALGAHYDHLGRGDHGNSLAAKEDAGQVHAGADDNASGSAAVLAIGEMLAQVSAARKRNVVLQFWSGEEIGLIGSSAYVNAPPVPTDQLAAYFNFDMVGRMQDNKLTLQATGTSPAWARLIEQANVMAGFDLLMQADPYQPTDVASFNQAGVPSLNFFTGTHVDYHKPSDTADKIEYDDLDRIVEFAAGIVQRVAAADEPPVFAKVEPQQTGGGRAGIRLFTGTIPDYSSDVKGLLLSGVVAGGPAEKAGLQKGDVVVEIAGQTIANIYDYTYALEVLKVDQPAKVIYMRGSERRETTLTPSARR